MKKVLFLLVVVGLSLSATFSPDCLAVVDQPVVEILAEGEELDFATLIQFRVEESKIKIFSQKLELPAADGFHQPLDTVRLNYGYHTAETAIADPLTGKPRIHLANDFDCEVGDIVYAITNSKVIKIGNDERSGKYIITAFHDRGGQVYAFFYAHLDYIAVEVGDVVESGKMIALGGSTGRSTNAHVHLELRQLIPDSKIGWYAVGRLNPTEYFFSDEGNHQFVSRFCCDRESILANL